MIFREAILHSWWVFLFGLLSYAGYELVAAKQTKTQQVLEQEIDDLQRQLQLAYAYQNQQALEIASQQDPSWVELTLLRRLGVVPEGKTKVYFYEPTTP